MLLLQSLWGRVLSIQQSLMHCLTIVNFQDESCQIHFFSFGVIIFTVWAEILCIHVLSIQYSYMCTCAYTMIVAVCFF